jgi:hypothetical protein
LGPPPGECVAVHPKELAVSESIADTLTQLAIGRPRCLIHHPPPVFRVVVPVTVAPMLKSEAGMSATRVRAPMDIASSSFLLRALENVRLASWTATR